MPTDTISSLLPSDTQGLVDFVFALNRVGAIIAFVGRVPEVAHRSLQQVIGKPLCDQLSPYSAALLKAAHQRALQAESVTYSWKPASGFPCDLITAPLRETDGQIIGSLTVGTFSCPTGSRALLDGRYLNLLDEFPVLIWKADATGQRTYCNLTWLQFTGRTLSQELGQGWFGSIHPDDLPAVLRACDQAIAAQGPYAVEYRLRHHSGTYRWMLDHGRPLFDVEGSFTGYVGVCLDISLHKQAEESRRRRETTQSLLHRLNGRILANHPVAQILQFACDQLVQIFPLARAWICDADEPSRVLASAGTTPGPECPTLTLSLETGEQRYATLHLQAAGEPLNPESEADLASFATQFALCIQSSRHQEQIHLQSAALEAAANAVILTDCHGTIRWVNPAFTALTGFSADEAIGEKPSILRSGQHSPELYADLWQTVLAGEVWQGQMCNRRKDGSTYFEEMTITPVKNERGEVTHFVAIKQDITLRREQEARIQFLASHDFLTNLINRHGLAESLRQAVQRAKGGTPSALVMVDLDNFKMVNDTVGHPAGDQLLVDVARLMTEAVRSHDRVGRFGGDEFGLLLTDVDLTQAREVAERLRTAIDSHRFHWGDHVFALTASIGIAALDGTHSADEVMALADAALYQAKHQGKNRVQIHCDIDEKDAALATACWVAKVKDAIREERFEVHYQPVTRLASGEPWHVEALVRMRDERGDLVPPVKFIPVAERFGFMPDIDRLVIRHAMETLEQQPDLYMFINLSGLTLTDDGLTEYVGNLVRNLAIDPSHICFEVTETVALMDLPKVHQRMAAIKAIGFRFALDDFGAGFASFSYLRALPVDYIKLDGSFTRNLDSDQTNRALAKAVVDVAHVLGKEVIAEQVEHATDAAVLEELGVEYGQGYLWGKPAPLQRKA